jgi:hypothetical protein
MKLHDYLDTLMTVYCSDKLVTIGYRLGIDWRSIESNEINHRI